MAQGHAFSATLPDTEFPYALLYRVWNEQIEILAVMHLSRKPGYWADRLTE